MVCELIYRRCNSGRCMTGYLPSARNAKLHYINRLGINCWKWNVHEGTHGLPAWAHSIEPISSALSGLCLPPLDALDPPAHMPCLAFIYMSFCYVVMKCGLWVHSKWDMPGYSPIFKNGAADSGIVRSVALEWKWNVIIYIHNCFRINYVIIICQMVVSLWS